MKKIKVLAVDDDAVARGLLEEVLVDNLDYDIISANDGDSAWKLLDKGERPDLCIFDMLMPGMGGLDLTRKLRADSRFSELPVVLCTAVGDSEILDAAANLDVSAYIMKPYQTESLVRELRELVALIKK